MKLFCFFLDVFIAVFRSAAVVVPQTQRGKQHFTEGPDIDHAPSRIQPLKGLQRMPTPPVFAIIVVLQNLCPALSGPLQQRQAAGKAHGYPGGKLMRGGCPDQTGLSRALLPMLHVEVAGILEPDGISRIE